MHKGTNNFDYGSNHYPPKNHAQNQIIIKKDTSNVNNTAEYELRTSNDQFTFAIGGSPSLSDSISASTVYTNKWYYVVGTYEGSTLKLYLNGTLINSKSTSFAIPLIANQLHIGDNYSSNFLNGRLGRIRVHYNALNDSQIYSTYLNEKPFYIAEPCIQP